MDEAQRQWLTLSLMIAVAAFIVASDVWLMKAYGANATYSRVASQLFTDYPIIYTVAIFSLGVLIGHTLLPVYARR